MYYFVFFCFYACATTNSCYVKFSYFIFGFSGHYIACYCYPTLFEFCIIAHGNNWQMIRHLVSTISSTHCKRHLKTEIVVFDPFYFLWLLFTLFFVTLFSSWGCVPFFRNDPTKKYFKFDFIWRVDWSCLLFYFVCFFFMLDLLGFIFLEMNWAARKVKCC